MKTAKFARPVYPAYRNLTSRHPLRTLSLGAFVALGMAFAGCFLLQLWVQA